MGVYNSISHIQRIAFIDGLTDTRAKELSESYPFAICYTDNENGIQNYIPGFWKKGKRYGIKSVDTTPIAINGIEFSLQLENNILKLYSGSVIKKISLANEGSIFEIYNVNNKISLTFRFFKDQNGEHEVLNNFPVLIVSDGDGDIDNPTSNYLSIFNIERDAAHGNTYNVIVNKNYESAYPLLFMHNQYTDFISVQIKPLKFPQDIIWDEQNNNLTIDNSIINSRIINFHIDVSNYHIDSSRFNLNNINFIVKQNGSSVPVVDFITSNTLFNSETGKGSITINCTGKQGLYTILTKFIDNNGNSISCPTELAITFKASLTDDDLYYIGNYSSLQINNNEISVQNVSVNSNIRQSGWHRVNDQLNEINNYYDYERYPFTSNAKYDCVIIPNGYSLCLPFFDEHQNRLEDTWWDPDINNSISSKQYITVNGRSYVMYRLNSDSLISEFVNSIVNSIGQF